MNSFYQTCLKIRQVMLWLVIAALPVGVSATTLDLATALERSLLHSPLLQSYPYQQRALEAQALQAGLKPNPNLSAELENVLGTGQSRVLHSAELTLGLSQLIEMGDKRQRRVDVVDARSSQLQQDYEVKRLDVLAETARHYYECLRLNALLNWNLQRIENENAALKVIQHRANAGAIGQADVLKMQLRLARSQSQQLQLEGQLQVAKQTLAANWAGEVDFENLAGDMTVVPALPDKQLLIEAINAAPAYLKTQALIRLRESQLVLAEAESQANINVGVAVRRLAAVDDNALVFSFSMPLQIHNRNQGNIASAHSQLELERTNQQLTAAQLELTLLQLRLAMANNLNHLEALQSQLVPVAESLLKQTEAGYQLGQYSVLQWVDAQSELFSVQRELIEARSAVHLQLLQLEKLTGASLAQNSISTTASQEK